MNLDFSGYKQMTFLSERPASCAERCLNLFSSTLGKTIGGTLSRLQQLDQQLQAQPVCRCQRSEAPAHLSGMPASCAATCLPKSMGWRSSLVMVCTSLEPSGRRARKYSLDPTASCSWLRAFPASVLGRAEKVKPWAWAACWNACRKRTRHSHISGA